MDTLLLHTLRTLARRLNGALVLLLLWSSLSAVTTVHAQAMPAAMPMEHHAMAAEQHHHTGHATVHSAHHQSPPSHPTTHQHGSGACCMAGQSCGSLCALSLVASPAYTNIQVVLLLPFVQPIAQAITRPLEPPRRPPKA